MRPSLSDTDIEAERVQLELLRGASPAARLRLALSLSRTVIGLSRRGLSRAEPDSDARGESALRFVELHYGRALAEAVRVRLRAPKA